MLYQEINVIILAAGRSTRMLSDISKIMCKIGGKYILQHLLDVIIKIKIKSIYIVYNNDEIMHAVDLHMKMSLPIYWIFQEEAFGTGYAVQKVLPMIIGNDEVVLVLYGDVPMLSYMTLEKLCFEKSRCDICILTAIIENNKGYGRVVRDISGKVMDIIEEDDIVSIYQDKIKEINTGIFITISGHLKIWLNELKIHSEKNEFYLTDIIKIAYKNQSIIHAIQPIDAFEIMGINNKGDLVYLERKYQKRQAQNLLSLGVMIIDPNRFDLRGTLVCGRDVCIDINVIIEGTVRLGDRVYVGASCILKNVVIEDDVMIYPFSIIENSKIECKSNVGPFTRLRSGTELQASSHAGNFVELKNTILGKNSKVKHLSYLGDAKIGSIVNIGAGTIICNYNGLVKNKTFIGDNVCIGANSQLIAPLIIENDATIGAGTTVTENVKSGDTVISRIRQFSILKKHDEEDMK